MLRQMAQSCIRLLLKTSKDRDDTDSLSNLLCCLAALVWNRFALIKSEPVLFQFMIFVCCSPVTHLHEEPSSTSLKPPFQALGGAAVRSLWSCSFSRLNKPSSPASPSRASAHRCGCLLLDVSQALSVLGGPSQHPDAKQWVLNEKAFSR